MHLSSITTMQHVAGNVHSVGSNPGAVFRMWRSNMGIGPPMRNIAAHT